MIADTKVAARARDLFAQHQQAIYRQTDRVFAGLMGFQWIAGIVFALWISPLAWEGGVSRTHVHVWAALFLGGLISFFPAALALLWPGRAATRFTIGIAQMLMGALLIHLTGGRIETHFHVFGSLAFLAFYRDWRVLIPATVVVALDHMLRGYFWPQSVYGVLVASQWRWVEHAAWVVFEDVILIMACLRSVEEMQQTAERTAALEQEVRTREQAEADARQARARNEAILDVALDCVLLMDPSGRIVRFNPAAERTFGFSAAEAVGIELAELIASPEHRDVYRTALAGSVAKTDAPIFNRHIELTARRKGGEEFPIEAALAPISADASAMFAGYMRDITERKRAERERAGYTQDLLIARDAERENAERLAILVEELRASQRLVEAATRAKSEFLASMSHELRTPLNAIILYAELLQEEAAAEHQDSFVRDLQKIQSAGRHLLELINGILDLSKIEAGKMHVAHELFDVRPTIAGVVDTVQPLVEKNNNALTVTVADDVASISGDQVKTRQILLNLLSNASKFTRNGRIALDVRHLGDDGLIEFVVSDTGIGMTPEQCGRIFEAFAQADVSTTRKYGGTGLGLAIVSRFCTLLGGTIGVVSEPGAGSRFTVRLPLVGAARADEHDVDAVGIA